MSAKTVAKATVKAKLQTDVRHPLRQPTHMGRWQCLSSPILKLSGDVNNGRASRPLAQWWEFQWLYHIFASQSQATNRLYTEKSNADNINTQKTNTTDACSHEFPSQQFLSHKGQNDQLQIHLFNSHQTQSQPPKSQQSHHRPIEQVGKISMSTSRQNQTKRQREWIYLCHYLAVMGLDPILVISDGDDGREPDFTLVFYQFDRLYYVGVELTTLPRLRDQMGEQGLIAKRWYWQSLAQMAKRRQQDKLKNANASIGYDEAFLRRYQLPVKTLYMPKQNYAQVAKATSYVTQDDINAVLAKKAHKVDAYHTRRPLQELWLLVHTDKYQPKGVLLNTSDILTHDSGFDQIHLTRYPSQNVLTVHRRHSSVD